MGHFLKYNGHVVKPLIRILGLSHTVGIEEEADQATLSVFPNPTADYTTFNWSLGEFRGKAILRIYDLSGRQVVNQSVNAFEGHWIWETHDVSNGIYLYELRTETQALLGQGKIVVKH
ncbi:MAG: T9SS type A sorting domain-containing protein, partial [Bacteroidetes bacterium]|nr:T9SS type A sorting domain-containing protein [Bacteroidota bacterium]